MPNQELEEVIKNPNRSIPTTPEPYVPEYVRFGKHPVIQDIDTVDERVIDNAEVNSHIIDNNVRVNLGFSSPSSPNSSVPKPGEYILMVSGRIVSCGVQSAILAEAKTMLYGEHSQFANPVDIDHIVILKRVGLKIGVFLNE